MIQDGPEGKSVNAKSETGFASLSNFGKKLSILNDF